MSRIKEIRKVDLLVKKYLPILIIVAFLIGLAMGYVSPKSTLKILKDSITAIVSIMIYAVLITMKPKDFVNAFKYPKTTLLGVFLTLIIAPILMLPFALYLSQDPRISAGLILASIVPPSGLLAYWTSILEANVGVAEAIEITTFLVSIVYVPYGMLLFAGSMVGVDVYAMFRELIIIVVFPLVLAIITRKILIKGGGEDIIKDVKPLCHLTSSTMALIMCIIAMALKSKMILLHPLIILTAALAALIYYNTAYLGMYRLSKAIKLKHEEVIPITYSVATKNLSVAMGLAATVFGPLTLLGVVACALFQMPLASLWYSYFKKKQPQKYSY